jgi:hypothetical protein
MWLGLTKIPVDVLTHNNSSTFFCAVYIFPNAHYITVYIERQFVISKFLSEVIITGNASLFVEKESALPF